MKDEIKLTLFSNDPDHPCQHSITIGNEGNLSNEERMTYLNGICNQQLLHFAVVNETSCPACLSNLNRDAFLTAMMRNDEESQNVCGRMVLTHIGLRNLMFGEIQEFGDISLDVDVDPMFFEESDHCGQCLLDID